MNARMRPANLARLPLAGLMLAGLLMFFGAPVAMADDPFITIWQTDNDGTSDDDQITIPGNGEYFIEWVEIGNPDNSGSEEGSGHHTVEFTEAGTYRVEISVGLTRINFGEGGDEQKILEVEQWGDIAWSSMAMAFFGAVNLDVTASDTPDLSDVERMSRMFENAESMRGNNANWEWNTGSVSYMISTFRDAEAFNQDLGRWDVSSLSEARGMLTNSGLSVENYDNLLIGWEGQDLNFEVPFGAAGIYYCEGEDERHSIIENYGWSINDDGRRCPAEFEVAITETDDPVVEGEELTVNADIQNIGDEPGAQEIVLEINGDETDEVDDVPVEIEGGATVPVTLTWNTEPNDAGEHTAIVASEDDSDSREVTVEERVDPAEFEVTITETNDPVVEGEELSVNADIQNIGDETDEQEVVLIIVGDESNEVDSEPVEIEGGATEPVELTWSTEPNDAGEYTAIVTSEDDSDSREVTVEVPGEPFITIWQTDNEGASDDDQITVPGEGSGYLIYWEEVGSPENSDNKTGSGEHTITFPEPGTYRVEISGDFHRLHLGKYEEEEFSDNLKILEVEQWGEIEWSSMVEAFGSVPPASYGAENLHISAEDDPDLSNVESTAAMFAHATSMNDDIGGWDTGEVTDMRGMFFEATSFDRDIGGWDVNNVTSMAEMFLGASAFNQDIGDWNTGNVETMRGMFQGAESFNRDIGGWDTGDVKSMSAMFQDAGSFNRGIGEWDTGNVENMSNMFQDAGSFNKDIGDWDTGSVTDMSNMFQDAVSFDQNIGGWETDNVVNMRTMFLRAESFNQNLRGWDIGNVDDMFGMLSYSGLSIRNYDNVLFGWEHRNNLEPNVFLGAHGLYYCKAEEERDNLMDDYGWTVFGDDKRCLLLEPIMIDVLTDPPLIEIEEANTTLDISDVVEEGRVSVGKFDGIPDDPKGIADELVLSEHWFTIEADDGLSFEEAEVHFDLDALGVPKPEEAVVHRREIPETPISEEPEEPEFEAHETQYDESTGESIVTVEEFGEFVIATTTEDPLISEFELSSPADGFEWEIDGSPEEQISLNWQETEVRTEEEPTYQWLFGEDEDVKDPLWERASDGGGADTSLTLTYEEIEAFLDEQGVGEGETLSGYWTVRAETDETDRTAAEAWELTLVRGEVTGAGEGEEVPDEFSLHQNYPNPFNPATTISYDLPERAEVRLTVYDILGRWVTTLVDEQQNAGHYQVSFDASELSSGTYIYRIEATKPDGVGLGDFTETRQMIFMK